MDALIECDSDVSHLVYLPSNRIVTVSQSSRVLSFYSGRDGWVHERSEIVEARVACLASIGTHGTACGLQTGSLLVSTDDLSTLKLDGVHSRSVAAIASLDGRLLASSGLMDAKIAISDVSAGTTVAFLNLESDLDCACHLATIPNSSLLSFVTTKSRRACIFDLRLGRIAITVPMLSCFSSVTSLAPHPTRPELFVVSGRKQAPLLAPSRQVVADALSSASGSLADGLSYRLRSFSWDYPLRGPLLSSQAIEDGVAETLVLDDGTVIAATAASGRGFLVSHLMSEHNREFLAASSDASMHSSRSGMDQRHHDPHSILFVEDEEEGAVVRVRELEGTATNMQRIVGMQRVGGRDVVAAVGNRIVKTTIR
eukprot:ANDGO_04641.mRNA.1 hypothetical protein